MTHSTVLRFALCSSVAIITHVGLMHAIAPPDNKVGALIQGGRIKVQLVSAGVTSGQLGPSGLVAALGKEGDRKKDAPTVKAPPVDIQSKQAKSELRPSREAKSVAAKPFVGAVEPVEVRASAKSVRSSVKAENDLALPVTAQTVTAQTGVSANNAHPAPRVSGGEEEAFAPGGEPSASPPQGAAVKMSDALSQTSGNAAASNYAGAVMRHLSRFKRPNASGRGSTYIAFTIAYSGDLERVVVSKSSGSNRFDRDAVKVVERAAPYPEPPIHANRNFKVKIEGR